jgi:DUF4097 and DUF4098 domain-containing protein YvlB
MTMLPAVLLLLAALETSAAATDTVEHRRPASPDGVVDIETMAGTVQVTGWDQAEILVTGKVGPRASLNLSGGSKRTKIEVDPDDHPRGQHAELDVKVPAGSRLRIEGFEASITVAGVTGSVQAETVQGSISVRGGATDVQLETVNGSIEVAGATGQIKAESVNGPVTVRDSSGSLEAGAVNGALLVTGGTFESVQLENVSGTLRFESGLAKQATLSVDAVSGAVELVLPATIAARFTVSTFSGAIESDFGAPSHDQEPGAKLNFASAEDGADVTVQTVSGDIRLRKRQ